MISGERAHQDPTWAWVDRTTVEQLAEFAGAKPSTVLNFLNTLVFVEEYLLTESAEQPTIIWVLLDAGHEKLLADLRSFSSSSDPELDEERLDGLQRIKQGIAELEQEIGYLKNARDQNDNIPEFETRIRERLSALGVGLRVSERGGHSPSDLATLR